MILVEVLYRYTSSSLITGNKSERCRKYTILYLDVRNKKNFVNIFRYFFFLFFHFSHRDRSFLRKWIINLFALTRKEKNLNQDFHFFPSMNRIIYSQNWSRIEEILCRRLLNVISSRPVIDSYFDDLSSLVCDAIPSTRSISARLNDKSRKWR